MITIIIQKQIQICIIALTLQINMKQCITKGEIQFKKKITNPRVKAFFEYIPYTVLSAMTFPGILYCTGSMLSAAVGAGVALILAFRNRSLLVVAVGACAGTLVVELLMKAFL